MVEQIRHIFKVRGKSEEKVEKLAQAFTGVFNLMREHKNWEQIDPNEVKNIFSKVSIAFKILPAKTVKKAIAKQFRPEWFIESLCAQQSWYKLAGENPALVKSESHVAYTQLQQ